jgi:NAD(P)-dependent dehydrogenase (short-subunit alcohol dehydrogenase family)
MALLQSGLLRSRAIAAAGVSDSVRGAMLAVGARVEILDGPELAPDDEERVGEWARSHAPLHALVYDAGALEPTDAIWAAVREVAVGALIPAQQPGKVVLIAPRPAGGAPARAMSAALENLARTLSVEWARFAVTAVAVAPGEHVSDEQLAELVCFLCSPAGDYLSGCRLEIGTVQLP